MLLGCGETELDLDLPTEQKILSQTVHILLKPLPFPYLSCCSHGPKGPNEFFLILNNIREEKNHLAHNRCGSHSYSSSIWELVRFLSLHAHSVEPNCAFQGEPQTISLCTLEFGKLVYEQLKHSPTGCREFKLETFTQMKWLPSKCWHFWYLSGHKKSQHKTHLGSLPLLKINGWKIKG